MPAPSVLDVVQKIAQTQPLTTAAVEQAAGVRLDKTGENAFFTFYDAANVGQYAKIEARIPSGKGPQKNGIVILTVAQPSVAEAEVGARFGAPVDEVFVPNPQRSPDQPKYVRFTQPWGELRLGFGMADGLLREIVLDGTSK